MMKAALLAIGLLLVAQPARAQDASLPIRWLYLAHAADVTSSLYAFSRGAEEANPVVISTQPALFITQMAGGAALEVFVLKKVSRRHPKWAKALAWTSIGIRGWVSARNIQVGRSERQ